MVESAGYLTFISPTHTKPKTMDNARQVAGKLETLSTRLLVVRKAEIILDKDKV